MFWWQLRFWLREKKTFIWELMGFWLLSIVLTWPMILSPATSALGSSHGDGMKHLWTLWWMRASIWDYGDFPFRTDLVNYPVGMDLYPIEPLNGLIACFLPFMSVVMLSNFLAILNMTLTGFFGAWCGRVLSGNRLGGIVCGLLLEGSSVMAFFVHVGVGELNHLWWLPLGLGCLVMARRSGLKRWFAAVALCLIGAIVSCFYLGFFLAMATLVWSLLTLWAGKDTPKLLLKYICTAAVAVMVVLPITQSFSASYKVGSKPQVSLSEYVTGEHGQAVTDPPSARLELGQLLEVRRKPERREEAAYGGGRYLGFIPLTLALVGLMRRPREALPWLGVGVVGLIFAFGTFLVSFLLRFFISLFL